MESGNFPHWICCSEFLLLFYYLNCCEGDKRMEKTFQTIPGSNESEGIWGVLTSVEINMLQNNKCPYVQIHMTVNRGS